MDEKEKNIIYEKILIQFLFVNERVRDRLVPFLNPKVFSDFHTSNIINTILEFMEQHEHFPKVNELKLFIKDQDIYDGLIEIMNIDNSEYDESFILGELEEFYRRGLSLTVISENLKKLKSNTNSAQNISDDLREALSFTFDDKIGTDLMNDSDLIFENFHRKDTVTPTLLKELDRYIEGGFHDKTLNLVMGPVNIGKTLILCALAANFLLQNKKILYITLEMSEYKIIERILANLFDIEIGLLKTLSREQFNKYYEMIRKKIKSNFHVVQYGAKTVSANKLRSILKEFEVKKGIKFDGVLIDYLGLMTTNTKTKDSNSYSELKLIAEETRSVFVEQDHPIFCATAGQVNRESFGKLDFDMSGIAESIGIAATCDIILGISSNDELKAAGKYKLNLLKNRYGINDIGMFVGVDYPKMRVYSLMDENEEKEIIKPKSVVDEAAVDVINQLKSNTVSKRNKAIGIE